MKHLLKQGINIKTVHPNYILELRNMKSQLSQVYLGPLVKIEIMQYVKLKVIVIIVFKRYPSTYCLMQR